MRTPQRRTDETAAGLYVHVPFCLTRCGYCDFNAYSGLGHLSERYVAALRGEADLVAAEWEGIPFASLYFGGGTPTTLTPDALTQLVERFRVRFEVADDAEVTTEANPDTVDERSLATLRAGGIGRLSLGVQSFDPAVLEALERVHPPESARRAYAAARRAGFDNVNLDLIYGARGETLGSWARSLDQALALGPEHVSCYALTIEPNTLLGRGVAAGALPAPDPDLQAAMYDAACERLAAAGYVHYEVSNWARPGFECVHNLGYWDGRAYLGLGAGAHSYRDGRRWWNVRPPERYLSLLLAGDLPIGGEERLDGEAARLEGLLLGLRQARGIPAGSAPTVTVQPLIERGLAEVDGERFRLTDRGLLLANEIVLAIAEAAEPAAAAS